MIEQEIQLTITAMMVMLQGQHFIFIFIVFRGVIGRLIYKLDLENIASSRINKITFSIRLICHVPVETIQTSGVEKTSRNRRAITIREIHR
uniref:Uncharacterized protein n=1 Tax=Onchocerca volvulus TaxID=6282 RepID=A0A8R1Y7F6_ONCVO